jgi:hypothetical protein
MCGRFRQTRSQKQLEERFQAEGDVEVVPRYNIAPTQPVVTVRQEIGKALRRLSIMRWGLIPSWAKDMSYGNQTVNARSETLTTNHLPVQLKLRGFTSKFVLRRLMQDKLPHSVLRRPKIGFDIPVHDWFRGVLRPLLLDILSAQAVAASGMFHRGAGASGAATLGQKGESRISLMGSHRVAAVDEAMESDRQASFDPKILAKGQTRWTGFDDKIISMYARGMTTREIQGHLEEIYGIEVSPTLISNMTDAVHRRILSSPVGSAWF